MAGIAVAAYRYADAGEVDPAVARLETLITTVREENSLPRRAFKIVVAHGLERFIDHPATREVLVDLVETLPDGSRKTSLSADVLMELDRLFQAAEISR